MTAQIDLTHDKIRTVQRPVKTLWGWLFLDPVAARLGKFIANRTRLTPMQLTLLAIALSILSALFFLVGTWWALVAGAILYQASTLADTLDGLVARAKPGSGSVAALILDHALDPFRLVSNVLALSVGQVLLDADPTLLLWSALFLAVHFADWIEPRTISKLRDAYRVVYEPVLLRQDMKLLALKQRFEGGRMKLIFFSVHERELCVLFFGPILGAVFEGLIVGTMLTALFFLLRIRFDVALLRNEFVNGANEYLGDSQNSWEAGIPVSASDGPRDNRADSETDGKRADGAR